MSSSHLNANFNNTREARDVLREIYGRYALGKDRYPAARIKAPIERLPERIRPVAKLITRAWETIDVDNAYFVEMVDRGAQSLLKSGKENTAALVVSKSGLNAVNLGKVSIKQGQPHTIIGNFTSEEAIYLVNNNTNFATGVPPVRYNESGEVEIPPYPDAVVLRPRHDGAALFFGDPGVLEGMATLQAAQVLAYVDIMGAKPSKGICVRVQSSREWFKQLSIAQF